MKGIKTLYQHLTNFLNGKKEDRRDALLWYDQLSDENVADREAIHAIQARTRDRILNSIQRERKQPIFRNIYRYAAGAAAILVCGYFVWHYYDKTEVIPMAQLAQVEPAQDRAIIVLEDGKELDLSQLAINQKLVVGNTVIIKDAQGKVSYLSTIEKGKSSQPNILRIPRAATYQLTLIDGTRVTLNSDSKLTYPSSFGDGDRIVELEGEAYFEVAHTHHNHKFVVKSKNQLITVLGTKFNVNAYPEYSDIKTTLVQGAVHVRAAGKSIVLAPNQQAIFNGNTLAVDEVDSDDILSWTKGQFCFDGSNTSAVLQEIARWYDVDVEYVEQHKIEKYIGKIPRNLPLDRLIDLLNYAELRTKAVSGNNKRIKLIIQ